MWIRHIAPQGTRRISAVAAATAVRGIGTADFASCLLHAVREGAPATYCSVVVASRRRGAENTDVASINGTDLSPAGREYAKRGLYRADKNQLVLEESNAPGLITVQDRGQISEEWRSCCYDPFGITQRCSIVMRSDTDQWISASLYRSAHDGGFERSNIEWLVAFAPVVLSAVMKHRSVCRDHDALSPEQRLYHLCATLTKREREVLLAACEGFTNKQIAQQLGVELTTVITHRQRAYLRLGITCHSDLIRLLLAPGPMLRAGNNLAPNHTE